MGVTAQALHGAKVCIIPQPENNYQPLMLRRRSLMAVSGLLVTAKVVVLSLILLLPATAELSTITSARIIQLTNEERARSGLSTLVVNEKLSKAAATKAQDMIDNDYFAHISPAGVTPWFWMQQAGYSYSVAGENLAIDFVQAEDVADAWMASPSHRDNILQPDYVETGVAVLTGDYQGGTSTVVVHMFGLPAGAVRPSQSSIPAQEPVVVSESPSPTPAAGEPVKVPPHELTPPMVPTISLVNKDTVVGDSVEIVIEAESSTDVAVFVNDQEVIEVLIDVTGSVVQKIDLSQMADGDIALQAVATNESNVQSESSATIELVKDTEGPVVNDEGVAFILSPVTDQPSAILMVPSGEYTGLLITNEATEPLSIEAPLPPLVTFLLPKGKVSVLALDEVGNSSVISEVDLLPAIFTDRNMNYGVTSGGLNLAARRLIIAVAIIVLTLLGLAVIIRVRIQHPRMISHATMVLLLAVLLLFV